MMWITLPLVLIPLNLMWLMNDDADMDEDENDLAAGFDPLDEAEGNE